MSNLVENELVLTGTPASLASARSTLGDPEADEADQRLLNFALLVPMPAGMIDRPPTEDCGSGKHSEPMDWYCWRLEHWGTAREASYVSLEGSPESGLLRYDFSTTNTPVIPLLPVIASRWSTLSIDFAYVAPAYEYAGSQHYTPEGGWSEAIFADDLPGLRSALGTSRLALRVPDHADGVSTSEGLDPLEA